MEEVLKFLNEKIRDEHGNPVSMESKWTDAEVDSFGTTMVFCDLDDRYGCFDKDWFKEAVCKIPDVLDEQGNIVRHGLMIREIVERAINESTKL